MAVTLTEAAAKRIKYLLSKDGNATVLRFGVKKSGCSGFAYTTELVANATSDDIEFVSFDVAVVVAKSALAQLDGTQIDYVKNGLQESFKFNNPNVADECGCGESFSVSPLAQSN